MVQDPEKTERPEVADLIADASNAETLGAESPRSGVLTAEDDGDKTGLPFSKARCIALVATVTGASFLNVSLCTMSLYNAVPYCFWWNACLTMKTTLIDPHRPGRGHYPADHWRRSRDPGESAAMGRVRLLVDFWLLSAALGPHR